LFVLLLMLGCTAPPAVKVDVLPGFDALFDNRRDRQGLTTPTFYPFRMA
jgi:hypothetical protein